MERWLGRYQETIYAVLRCAAGLLFACHGAQKLFGVFGTLERPAQAVPAFGLMWMAGIIELVTGALVAIGLFASPAAFLASGQMAVAYFMAHFSKALLPIQNGGELAVLYAWLFLYIAAKGAGILSLDAARKA